MITKIHVLILITKIRHFLHFVNYFVDMIELHPFIKLRLYFSLDILQSDFVFHIWTVYFHLVVRQLPDNFFTVVIANFLLLTYHSKMLLVFTIYKLKRNYFHFRFTYIYFFFEFHIFFIKFFILRLIIIVITALKFRLDSFVKLHLSKKIIDS